MKPLAVDLCCGLGGWSNGLLAEGWDVIGYDIERHDYGNGSYPGKLILQDIRTIDGREFRGKVSLITASPPCTEYAYMAMPWTRAKQIRNALLGKGEFPKGYKGSKTISELNDLFNHCVRIGQEAGCPIIIENVRGAQEWVGKARWFFGSFGLWGDVPALMPIPAKFKLKTVGPTSPDQARNHNCHINEMRDAVKSEANKTAGLAEGVKTGVSWSKSGPGNPDQSFQTAAILKCEGNKTVGMNWSDQTKRGQDFTRIAGQQAEGIKMRDEGYDYPERTFGWKAPPTSSKSSARKQASAEIAKIPYSLAAWIAKCFKPVKTPTELIAKKCDVLGCAD